MTCGHTTLYLEPNHRGWEPVSRCLWCERDRLTAEITSLRTRALKAEGDAEGMRKVFEAAVALTEKHRPHWSRIESPTLWTDEARALFAAIDAAKESKL